MTEVVINTRPRKHRWPDEGEPGFVRTLRADDGNEHIDKVCLLCGMTRTTVINPRGHAWHEWTTRAGQRWIGELTPPCLGVAGPAQEVAEVQAL